MQLKIPPRNTEAERAVLGACLLSKDALGSAIEILKPDDFYDINNKTAYEIMLAMYSSDKPVDFVTFSNELKNREVFDRLGGQPFLAELVGNITTIANVSFHAGIVREYSMKRRLIEAGNKIIDLAYKNDIDSKTIINEAEKIIFEAAQNKSSSDFRSISELLAPVFVKIEDRYEKTGVEVTGYPSGFKALDEIITGFQPGSLNVIAARPSMGKTALALNIAQFGGGEKNYPIIIFSLEMSAEQLIQRMLAAESKVNLNSLNTGSMGRHDWIDLQRAAGVVTQKNIFINDGSDLTIMDFRTKCRRFKNRHPDLGLIIVDYLQLMSSGDRRPDNRQQEVSEISRLLKVVAREINCPIIALSQLSREAEKRSEKRPQLSDLRDSGAIEQDADTVILIFREDYYQEKQQDDKKTNSKADIRVAKNRNGSTGVCSLTFQREITRFWDYVQERI